MSRHGWIIAFWIAAALAALLLLGYVVLFWGSAGLAAETDLESRITHVTCRIADLYNRQQIPPELYVAMFAARETAHEAYHRWEVCRSDANAGRLAQAVAAMDQATEGWVK